MPTPPALRYRPRSTGSDCRTASAACAATGAEAERPLSSTLDARFRRVVELLDEQNQFAIKYDLDAMRRAIDLLGSGAPADRVVLVGGTNGKGTTTAYLNALAIGSGKRVGMYTSPHLLEVRERVRLNGVPVDRATFVEVAEEVTERFSGRHRPPETPRALTYFELLTVIAWRVFAESRLDLAVVEVGLGGRLDATNVLDPIVSIIASVSFDHEVYLGDTLAAIAGEKAGIVRSGRPCVIHRHSGGYTELARAIADRDARAEVVEQGDSPREWCRAMASTAWRLLGYESDDAELSSALDAARWPGRQQTVHASDGRRVLVDGAHNVAAALQSVEWITASTPDPIPLIFAVSGPRDPVALAAAFAPAASEFVVTAALRAPCQDPDIVAQSLRAAGLRARTAPSPTAALRCTDGSPLVGAVGSLYLAGEVLGALGQDIGSLSVFDA